MGRAERIEDLGRLREKLSLLCNSELFEYCGSKHDYEPWKKLNMPEDDEDFVHRRIRHFYGELVECLSIATGGNEDE